MILFSESVPMPVFGTLTGKAGCAGRNLVKWVDSAPEAGNSLSEEAIDDYHKEYAQRGRSRYQWGL